MDTDKFVGILIITVGFLIVMLSFVHCRNGMTLVKNALEKCSTEDCRESLLKGYFNRDLKKDRYH